MLSGGTKSKAKRNPEKEGKDSNRTDTDNMQGVEDGNQETTDSLRAGLNSISNYGNFAAS